MFNDIRNHAKVKLFRRQARGLKLPAKNFAVFQALPGFFTGGRLNTQPR
jgi:hypothetical protein